MGDVITGMTCTHPTVASPTTRTKLYSEIRTVLTTSTGTQKEQTQRLSQVSQQDDKVDVRYQNH
jgi:hypothetical protein